MPEDYPAPGMAMPNLYCPSCGNATPHDATSCARCGATLPSTPVSAYPPVTHAPSDTRRVVYGGFWMRFAAAFLDAVFVQVVVMPVSFVMGAAIGAAGGAVRMPEPGPQIVAMIAGAALGMLASWVYEAYMESSEKQATFGKMLLGLMVTDEAGRRISFARASGRHFAKYISGMILLIGYIMAGLTAKKQALHDMIAGTLVVRKQ